MQKRIDFISFEEFQKLYKAEKDKSMKLAYLLMFGSGLRISEVIGLEKEISSCCKADVVKKKLINKNTNKKRKANFCFQCNKELQMKDIRRKKGIYMIAPLTADKINLVKHQIRIDEAKGNKWRITITPPILKEEMLKLLPIQIERRTFQRRLKQLSLKVLNKPISPHTLRHGFANNFINVLKIPLPMVQQYLGHSRLDTTGIYAKSNPEQAIAETWKMMGGE